MSTQIAGTARPDPTKQDGRGNAKELTGRLTLCDGQQAISDAEQIICGKGAVDSPAQAYGLALSNQRAASLLAPTPELEQPLPLEGAAHQCVYHRWTTAPHPTTLFELFPASPQEAVDLSLVAHVLCNESGEAVTCRVDQCVASAVGPVRLLNSESVEGLLQASATAEGSSLDAEKAVALAEKAFRDVALTVRRQVQPISCYQTGDAEIGLIALGTDANRAVAAVDLLRGAGVRAGVIGVTMREPFPAAAVQKALDGINTLFVVLPKRGPQSFLKSVRGSLGKGSAIKAFSVSDTSKSATGLATTVAKKLPTGAVTLEAKEEKRDAAPVFRVASLGAGSWGTPLLLEVVRNLARVEEAAVAYDASPSAPYAVVAFSSDSTTAPGTDGECDVLLAPQPSALDAGDLSLRAGGAVIAATSEKTGRGPAFDESVCALLGEKKISVFEINMDAIAGNLVALQGAVLHVIDHVSGKSELKRIIDALAGEQDESAGLGQLLLAGAEVCRAVSLEDCEAVRLNGSQPSSTQFVAPSAPEGEQDADEAALWRNGLRHFHVTGDIPALAARAVGQPLLPVSGRALYGEAGALGAYPYLFGATEDENDAGTPWSAALGDAVSDAALAGLQLPIIKNNLSYLTSLAAAESSAAASPVAAGDLYQRSAEIFADTADLSEAGATSLAEELSRFLEYAPQAGSLIGFSSRTLFDLLVMTQRKVQTRNREAFNGEIAKLSNRLQDVLRVDDTHDEQAAQPETLSASLGKSGGLLIDPTHLSKTVLKHRGSTRLSAQARQRIKDTLGTLQGFLAQKARPELYLLHREDIPFELGHESVSSLQVPDALITAIGFFDGQAARMLDVFRAIRVARLDAAGEYDPKQHDQLLARLTWEACEAEELAQLPVVAVYEKATHLAGLGLGALSNVLRSGRPVRIFAVDDRPLEAREETESALSAGLGLLAIAHREAFVLQTTLARPGHLARGLNTLLKSDRPAVAIVATSPETGAGETWLRLAAAHEGRAFPCFTFNPEQGDSWATRFDLSENAKPADSWPAYDLELTDADGETSTWTQPLTYADAAALDPAMRDHFVVLPEDGWSDEQVELSDYLANADAIDVPKIPFIWVVGNDGALRRAVLTRALAFSSWVHMRMWRMLQELGGINNSHVLEAAAAVKQEVLAEAEAARQALEAEHDSELERVKNEAAQDTMERLVSVLLDENFTAAAPTTRLPAPPAADRTVTAEAAPVAVPDEEPAAPDEDEGLGFDEAFIDTFLCTSCNECTNINPALFQYDGNKQAVLGDLSAGTFDQLVVAAEKCPARCIHPGAPRSDDSTATPELVLRAAQFN